jgi:hypothetical protein
MQNGTPFLREDWRRTESPDQRVDIKRELPDDLGDRRDALHRPTATMPTRMKTHSMMRAEILTFSYVA